jgi:hypothetical protein
MTRLHGAAIGLALAAAAAPLAAQVQRRSPADSAATDTAFAQALRTRAAPLYLRFDLIRPLPDGRVYAIVGRAANEEAPSPVFVCLTPPRTDSAAAPGCLPLPLPGRAAGLTAEETTQFGASHGDLDNDGELELQLYIAYGVQSQWSMERSQFFVVDLTPAPRVAAQVHVNLPRGVGVEPELTFTDLNSDGHPDIQVEAQACHMPPSEGSLIGCRPIVHRLLWNAASDSWAARRGGGR